MKLGMKLLAAPLLTAALVLLSGQINTFLLGHEADKGLTIARASVDDFKTVASVQQQVSQLHTSVYKTVALIESLDETKIKAFRTDLASQLSGVKRVAGALAPEGSADTVLVAAVNEVGVQIDKYIKQADTAIDLASVDSNTGIAAMQGADATFSSLSKTMSAILEHSEASAEAVIANAQQRSRYTNWLLSAAGLLLAAMAVWLSWLMQRKLVAELARAVKVTHEVAKGNLHVDASSERTDEVGDLMHALGAMTAQLNH